MNPAEQIRSHLRTKWAGQKLQYFDEVDSTNTRAKELGSKGAVHGTLVVTGKQNQGRGRRGRGWESPAGENIAMTILLRPDFSPEKAPMLTLLMAHAAAAAIQEETGTKIGIKWPNDLVLNKKKICGILTEMRVEKGGIRDVVIGVGINANTETFPEELQGSAASLKTETGKSVDQPALIAAVMQKFEKDYEEFCRAGSLSPILNEYNEMLVNRGQEVRVLEPGNEYTAHSYGIDETGELQVEKEDGTRVSVFAGEVSVRGIYGYV